MDEPTVKTMLNTMSEWQAQKDLLNMEKRKLIEEVSVPDDVQAIVSAGTKRMTEVDDQLSPALEAVKNLYDARMSEIVVPIEIKEALSKIDLERDMLLAYRKNQEEEIRNRAQLLRKEIEKEIDDATRDVFISVERRRAEIEAEFSGKYDAVDKNISKLTDEIKNAVKEIGFTVDGEFYQARYTKPKKSWIPQRLDKYTEDHPDIKSCYTLGDSSVAIVRK